MPDWARFVAMALVLSVGAYLFWVVTRLGKLEELDDEERRAKWPAARDRMLRTVGFWQWCVAFVILSIPDTSGGWINTIALFGMGAALMLWPRWQRKLDRLFSGSS